MLDLRLASLALSLGLVSAPAPRQESPEPTAAHERLQTRIGVWEGTMTTFVPGMDPIELPCREVVTGVGPFWIRIRFEFEFMGVPYTGSGHLGYDPEAGEYLGNWVDSMTPHLALMRGELQDDETLVLRWESPDESGTLLPHRSETVRKDGTYEAHYFRGEDTPIMDLEMKRVATADEAGAGK